MDFKRNETVDNGGVITPPKQIVIYNIQANAVMYTVPAGKKFVGHIYQYNSTNYYCYINGVPFYAFNGNSTYVASAGSLMELTLVEGTVVQEAGTASVTFIMGVEYDA